jgi:hypothetical protein
VTFPWEEYLRLAEALVQQRETFAHEEACCRASISRAYYALYGAARQYARERAHLRVAGRSDDHRRLIDYFQQGPSGDHQTLGHMLRRLRTARNRADYDETISDIVRMAETAVLRARDAFTVLHALPR